MSWAAVAGAGVGLLGTMMAPKNQSSTNTKEPWAPAQAFMAGNLARGQQLQDFYQQNPFSNAQKAAYGNQFALSDQYRQMMPQLAAGLNRGQFDRSNPTARPTQTQFSAPNLGMSSLQASNPFAADQMPSTAPIAPPPGQAPGAAPYKGGFWDPLSIDPGGYNKKIVDPIGLFGGGGLF